MRKIIHVDMDCFYASVETKYQPRYRGKPLGVGGPPNSRSVLCTANYEARKFGVRAAMPSSQAVRLCPQLILVPPNFELYRTESRAVREIFARFTDRIEPLSLDEAYLDVTDSRAHEGNATKIAHEIRRMIFEERKLTASAGIAPNKLLAKIAGDWRKPNNQFTIQPHEIESFMPALPVEKLFGVGRVTAQHLHERGLKTCGDLQRLSLLELQQIFGRRGSDMHEQCRGIDHRAVKTEWIRKSLTVEDTFSTDLQTLAEIEAQIPALYDEWRRRLDKGGYHTKIRGWVVKLKFFDFQSTTHETSAETLPSVEQFGHLFRKAFERHQKPVRLLGLGVRLGDDTPVAADGQLEFFGAGGIAL